MSNIITTSDLNSYMNKTLVSSVATSVVNAVNQWIETQTHRSFGETKQVTERYDWQPVTYLRHQDIVSVDQVTFGWPGDTTYTAPTDSYWSNQWGRLTLRTNMLNGFNFVQSRLYNDYMQVKYTYGVPTVPDDLKLAALGIAAGFYNWATNNQKDVVASQVGSYRLEYSGRVRSGATGPDPANSTSDANWQVIDSYRTQRM